MIPTQQAPRPTQPVEAAALRRTCAHFATGVTVITTGGPDHSVGATVNSFTSVSLDPPLVLFCLHRGSRLRPVISGERGFVVNFLAAQQEPLAQAFAARESAVFEDVTHHRSADGLPILSDALAFLACRLLKEYDGGDHIIVLGEVVDLGVPSEDEDPLIFYRGAMHALEERPGTARAR
ncbi:flavin reductase family protein [Streptacidiphilus sp. PAMC 29251]